MSQRFVGRWCSTVVMLASVAWSAQAANGADPEKLRVYIGTYTGQNSKGIYVSELDLATGKLAAAELAGEANSPSFLAIHPDGKLLVAVNEISNLNGQKVGGVTSFAIEPKTGKLTSLSQQPSGGGGPCHVVIDKSGKYALAANYGGGSVCALPIGADGKLGEQTGFAQHTGRGPTQRQSGPNAHSINMSPDNRFALAADLGLDKVLVYKLDAEKGTLTPNDPPSVSTKPGGGPRHFAFHPNGKAAYVCLEMTSEITAFKYDPEKGVLTETQTLSTLPEPTPGNSTAEVQVHPSGKYVYVSNRGHNSIAMFAIGDDGKLTALGHQKEGIKIPRNFGVDPTGKYALVANQDGDSVIVFKIDAVTGKLEPTGNKIEVGKPVCVKFLPL